ncbi:hypothetical protein N9060_01700 [Arenicella sp.]|nr:hypothetical protein [Arenicella sp.]
MTDSSALSAQAASDPGRKRFTLLVWGAVLFIVATLLFMAQLPEFLYWPVRILFAAAVGWLAIATFLTLRAARFDTKKVVFSLVLVVLLYGALFLICFVFVKLMAARDERMASVKTTSLSEKARSATRKLIKGNHPALFDAEAGWVPRPDYQWKIHKIGVQGLRGDRVYPESPADEEKRILCLGDSFTFGYEVEDDQTFPSHGEQLRPETEWLNLGICGTGLTQALQHYRKTGRKFGGKYVVIGFMTKDAKRTVNCFRGFVSQDDITPFAQPFAKVSDGQFSIEDNPYQEISDYQKLLDNEEEELQKLYQLDYLSWSKQRASTNPIVRTLRYIWERRSVDRNVSILLNRTRDGYGTFRLIDDPYGSSIWHPDSPGFQANAQVFDLFYKEIIEDGREPLIVILPSGRDVEDRHEGRRAAHASLLEYLQDKGYRHFDFLDSLEAIYKDKLSPDPLYVRTHFNGATNKLLAEEIIKALSL